MTNSALRTSPLEKVARIFAGDLPPASLISELEWLSDGISADLRFEKRLPTRRELRKSLIAAKEATQLLMKLCESSISTVFLDSKKLGKFAPDNYDRLALLNRQLFTAIKTLQAKDGTTSRGANRVRLPGSLSSKTLVAARVAELFSYFRGKDPVNRDREAASAAETLWRTSGGKSSNAEDVEESWRQYFRAVKRQEKDLIGLRRVWRRGLEQAEQRGRAPFSYRDIAARG
jgi:hypothetical protein